MFMDGNQMMNINLLLRNYILNSEWSDECIDFTMMCVFFLVFVSMYLHHNLSK